MLFLKDVEIHYGDRILFEEVSFMVSQRDIVGLVGKNGSGKTTLLKIINNEISPDTGTVTCKGSISIGYLAQELELDEQKTVRDSAKEAFGDISKIDIEIGQIQEKLQRESFQTGEQTRLIQKMSDYIHQLELLGVEKIPKTIENVLLGLGFSEEELDLPVFKLSGGWKMRVQLAKLLLGNHDLLLLDEPTNHLDMEAIVWLETYVKDYPGAVILISHDQEFLQNTCNRIIEITGGLVQDYSLRYHDYLNKKKEINELNQAAYLRQQRVINEKERTINRFIAKATKTSMAQSMRKQLDKMERIQWKPEVQDQIKIKFFPPPRSAKVVVDGKSIVKFYGEKCVLSGLDIEICRGDRIAIVGQNGQGKTTLARILVLDLSPTKGTVQVGERVNIGYYAQNEAQKLNADQTCLEYIRNIAPATQAANIRNVLGAFQFSDADVDKKIGVLSGGERARLIFASIILQPLNFLVLDEPTNHLDIPSKTILKEALLSYSGTLLIVSHDRDFLRGLTSETIELRNSTSKTYWGDVDYFLERRAYSNLREVALNKKEESSKKQISHTQSQTRDHNRDRKTKQRIQKLEKEILNLEQAIRQIENKISENDFYTRPDAFDLIEKYNSLKLDLERSEKNWENMIEKLGNQKQ